MRPSITIRSTSIILIYRILIIALLFTICRVLFLVFNFSFFSLDGPAEVFRVFLAGLRFDFSVIIMLNAPVIVLSLLPVTFRIRPWYRKFCLTLLFLINSVALLANCIDLAYFPYTLKRTGADIFSFITIGKGGDLLRLLPSYFRDFWYILILWAGLVVMMIYLILRHKENETLPGNKLSFYFRNTVYLFLGTALGILISRGGLQLRPLGIISAGENVRAQNIPLVLNTPFTIIQTIGREQIEIPDYYPDDAALNAVFSPVRQYEDQSDSLNRKNVVIIILEGISKEQMGWGNQSMENGNYHGYTPFLDSLASVGMSFDRAFANGKKSIEGIPSVIAGLPSLSENPYLTGPYAGNALNALPSLLKPLGYRSAFFHGGTNGTMQFDAFASLAGYDQYFGRSEYNNDADFDGHWGIWDEEFLQFTARKLGETRTPFFASIFTLSSHHPYAIPAKHKGEFPKGTLEIHESVGYTDFALKRFFHTISHEPWYKNTLFVITSDHSSATFSEYYQNSLGNLAIPMIYFTPDGSLHGQQQEITQQIDILPSVLDYLRYPGRFVAFGESVFDPGSRHYSICYFNNVYQLVLNDLMIQFNGEKLLAVYDILNDRELKNNLVEQHPQNGLQAEKFLKAIIQSYNTRIKNNELILRP